MSKSGGIFRTKPVSDLLEEKDKTGLSRSLGSIDLTALGIGAIIGTGIFVLTGVAASQYAGPGLIISFIISGFAAGMAALVYAELAAMIPVAGSAYTYTYASLGELIAWIVGWNLILEYMIAAGAVAIGWGSYFTTLLGTMNIGLPAVLTRAPESGGYINLPAVLIIVAVGYLVIRGTKQSAEINKVMVALKILVILFFLALGAGHINPANWRPFLPYGVGGIFRGASIIFFAYIGFDAVSTAAEETRMPQRDVPTGIVGSLGLSTILYIAVTVVLTGLLPYTALNTASPVAAGLIGAGFRWAGGIVSVGALTGITSVLLVMVYAQSRILMAMARDGLLPPLFSRVHPRFRTPYFNTIIVGLVAMLTAGFLPIGIVAQLANIGTLSAFIITSAGVLVMRKKRPDLKRPFKTPGYPYTPVLSILFCLYLVFNLPALTWIRLAIWLALGMAVYLLYGYRHSRLNEPAPGPVMVQPAGKWISPLSFLIKNKDRR